MSDEEIIERSPDGRYSRFNQQLGHGAFKAVFKGYDEEEGIEVAWCQVNMDRVGEVEKAQIHTEVDILKSLTHKHILTFFAYFDLPSTKQIVFITEIMTSGTLKQYIHKARRVKRKVVKKWCRQILDGLSFLHAKRIIHRDLKCDNIFINGNNSEIKIGDLGLSTLMREGQGQAQSVLGTPEFMAPELYDELYDEKVDIYAFGMCVLEMVTSEYPYSECLNAAQIYRKVTQRSKPASLQKIVDEQTKQFIEECLEHDHGIRPSATALLGHDYLQPPFGGPGTKDDEPVELLPKKDAATKDTVIREPLQLQPLLAIQPGQHQPSAPQPPLLAQQQLSQQQPTPPLLHAQPPRPMMSDCASSVARAPAAASPQSSSAPTTLPLRDVVAVECAHASRILPGVVSPMGDLLPAAAPSAPPTTTQGEGCCAHADLTSGNALAPALAPATCEFGRAESAMSLVADAVGPVVTASPSSPMLSCQHLQIAAHEVMSSCAAAARGAVCTPLGNSMGEPHATVLELTCQVVVEGEHKSVTFSMDFAHDTPRAVAKEMVDELRMEESEATISDIIHQIEQFRPVHLEALPLRGESLVTPQVLTNLVDEPSAEVPAACMPHLEHGRMVDFQGRAQAAVLSAHLGPAATLHPQCSVLGSSSVPPQTSWPGPEVPAETQRPSNATHCTATTPDPQLHATLPITIQLQPPPSLSTACAGDAVHPSFALDGGEVEGGSGCGAGSEHGLLPACTGAVSAFKDPPDCATNTHSSIFVPGLGVLPPQSHTSSQHGLLANPPEASNPMSTPAMPVGTNVTSAASRTFPPQHHSAACAQLVPAGGMCSSALAPATLNSAPLAHAASSNAAASATLVSSGIGGPSALPNSGVAAAGSIGGKACASDDDDGDMDDKEIMQRIEIQQLREIEEMKERHRKQNTRMLAMIQRRAQERASRRGVEGDM